MLFAADYPFLNIFWTMILFFFWVAWIWVLVTIIGDLFRRHDASGWTKALWIVFLIFLPFLGVLLYMIVNGKGMSERSIQQAQANAPSSTTTCSRWPRAPARRTRSRRPRACSTAARSPRPSSTR